MEVPLLFEQLLIDPIIPNKNPLTKERIVLGKKIFFERKLSKNNYKSCTNCHNPRLAFSGMNQFSIGVEGHSGTRNTMELCENWTEFAENLQQDTEYTILF